MSGDGHESKGFGPVLTSAVHDRMPVILDSNDYDLWLDLGMNDVAASSELLKSCDARLVRCYRCSVAVEVPETQSRLFS